MAKPVKEETDRIEKLLKRDDLTNKQRLCLSMVLYTIRWTQKLGKDDVRLENPSEKIMKASDKSVRKSPTPKLPILSLDEAIKRLGDDKIYTRVAKGFRFDEDD